MAATWVAAHADPTPVSCHRVASHWADGRLADGQLAGDRGSGRGLGDPAEVDRRADGRRAEGLTAVDGRAEVDGLGAADGPSAAGALAAPDVMAEPPNQAEAGVRGVADDREAQPPAGAKAETGTAPRAQR